MLNGLQTEIDAHPELTGASREIIMRVLNQDGSAQTETWEVKPLSDGKITISKAALLTYLTATERKALRQLMASGTDDGDDLKMLYEADDVFWVNDPTFRGLIESLTAGGMIGVDAANAVKRLGERQISRAEEVFGRKIGEGDFE
jgi:hypothetical protein